MTRSAVVTLVVSAILGASPMQSRRVVENDPHEREIRKQHFLHGLPVSYKAKVTTDLDMERFNSKKVVTTKVTTPEDDWFV